MGLPLHNGPITGRKSPGTGPRSLLHVARSISVAPLTCTAAFIRTLRVLVVLCPTHFTASVQRLYSDHDAA